MAELAIRLSMYSDQPVVDQTDSAGLRTFMLDFEPSKNSPDAALGRAVSGLGLKVRPSRFPVPVLVVDSVAAKPTVE